MQRRVMFNGPYSYCPRCGDDMFVPIDEEEEDGKERRPIIASNGPISGTSDG
jgi:hypothetical protein